MKWFWSILTGAVVLAVGVLAVRGLVSWLIEDEDVATLVSFAGGGLVGIASHIAGVIVFYSLEDRG